MKKWFSLQFLIFLLIYTAITFYIGWNGWIWLHSAFGLQDKWIYGVLFVVVSYSYLIDRYTKKWHFFKIIGSYWIAVIQYSIILFPLADVSFWILSTYGLPETAIIVWIGAFILVAFFVLFGYGTFNAYNPVVRNYSIVIPKQANGRSGLRIAMASDMHFGNLSGLSHLRRLVKEVKDLNSDIILLPGDIIEDELGPFMRKKMGDVMGELSAPLGVYGVLGNHEYYGGAIPEFLKEMERIGVTILLDESVKVDDSFYLVGRKDKTDSNRFSMEELLGKIDLSSPIIVMDHQPGEIKHAKMHGADLILSGHTHRGQMAPNHLITRKMFELDWGYMKKNQLHTIVSSGYGFWGPPLRIGSRSEIVQIDISFGTEI
ncbi:metallophosphoesterase [Bacillus sp. 1NLA3E]|uniref:metallophosphoesterase n=1 Tax=Bacillus sp. 1NLA3E TaxID=666686 RepID=UPI000247EBBE|nr:metallophosphoesterase [Bacillus sp. 1NLA3E]AGK53438.1 Phosphoesterase [Bacillus sp. 1NLA3E]